MTFIILFLSCINLPVSAVNLVSIIQDLNQHKNIEYFDTWIDEIGLSNKLNNQEKLLVTNVLIDRSQDLGFSLQNSRLKFRKSIILTTQGNLQGAMDLLNEAIPIFDKKDSLFLAASFNSAGGMLSAMGEYAKAKNYLFKAIETVPHHCPKIKLIENIRINNHLVLGSIYYKYNEMDSAKTQFLIANKMCDNKSKEKIYATTNLSSIYQEQGNYRKSIALNYQALSLAKNNNPEIQSNIYNKLALSYLKINQYDSSYYCINQAEEKEKKYQLNQDVIRALITKAKYYKQKKQYKQAVQTYEEYNKLKSEQDLLNKKARENFMVSQTKLQDEKEAALKIEKEKGKQRNLQFVLFTLLGLVITASLITYFWFQRRKLKQQLEPDRVEKEMFKSQIRAINSQMNPHFVFNSLNSIQELIVLNDIRNSNLYLGKFADLMRKTLEYSQEDEILLSQEIEVLKLYLDLEQKRFGEDLIINFNNEISEEASDNYRVPSLLFQPYVENSLKHGLLHKEGEKKLDISFKEKNGNLLAIIADNGIGRKKSKALKQQYANTHKSCALNANAKRLELIKYSSGKDIQVNIIDLDNDQGTRIEIVFLI